MIKKILIIITILVFGFIILKPIIASRTVERDIKNFLNRKSTANISKETIDLYKDLENPISVTEIDISDLVYDYFRKIINNLSLNNRSSDDFNETRNYIRYVGISNFEGWVLANYYLTESEYKQHNSGQLIEYLASSLENYIDHNSTELYKGWTINTNNKDLIKKLPYNTILTYIPLKINKYNKVCTDVDVYTENDILMCKIKYKESENDIEKEEFMPISYKHTDWWHKNDITLNIYGWFFDINDATVQLSVDLTDYEKLQ